VMRELYHDQDLTQEEIADELGCGEGTVNRWVHNFNLEVSDIGSTNEQIRDVDLSELYWDRGLSQKEIAQRCDCSVALVSKQMNEQDIPVRGGYDGKPTLYTGSQSGYERIYCRDVDESAKCLHHRLVAVAKYGFDAVRGMDVHHLNGVQWDTRPSNIIVLPKDEHAAYHANL
jgi:transposase